MTKSLNFHIKTLASEFEIKEYYDQIYDYNEYPISRSYLPTKVDNIGGTVLIKELLKRFKKKLTK